MKAIYLIIISVLHRLLTILVPVNTGVYLFNKDLFVKLYKSRKYIVVPKLDHTSSYGRTGLVKTVYYNDIIYSYNVNGHVQVVLEGNVHRDKFYISIMTAVDHSLASARGACAIVEYLIMHYKKINPGEMTKYSASLYWSYMRKRRNC